MIKQNVIVSKIENNQVWIENQQKTACSSCLQKDSCSTSLLEKWLPKRMVAVDSELTLNPGDEVIVAIDERQLIQATLLLYLLPLLVMFLGAGVSSWLIPDQENWIIFTTLGSFFLALWAIHKFQYWLLIHYTARPQVVGRVNEE